MEGFNKETLKYIVDLGQPQAEIIEDSGLRYEKSQHGIKLMPMPSVKPMRLSTLSGLVEYIMSDTDLLPTQDDEWIIQVQGFDKVALLTQLSDGYKDRECYAAVEADAPGFKTNEFMDVETFIIALQSRVLDAGDKAKLIAFCSTLQDVEEQKMKDNGVSQTVTAKVGISTVADVEVPNPVALAPYRTFCDIEQPISNFIFRGRRDRAVPCADCSKLTAAHGARMPSSLSHNRSKPGCPDTPPERFTSSHNREGAGNRPLPMRGRRNHDQVQTCKRSGYREALHGGRPGRHLLFGWGSGQGDCQARRTDPAHDNGDG